MISLEEVNGGAGFFSTEVMGLAEELGIRLTNERVNHAVWQWLKHVKRRRDYVAGKRADPEKWAEFRKAKRGSYRKMRARNVQEKKDAEGRAQEVARRRLKDKACRQQNEKDRRLQEILERGEALQKGNHGV